MIIFQTVSACPKDWVLSGCPSSTGQLNLISAESFQTVMSKVTQWGILKKDDFLFGIKGLPAAGSLGTQYRQ